MTESDLLNIINDALSDIAAQYGLVEHLDDDQADEAINRATHAAFNIMRKEAA